MLSGLSHDPLLRDIFTPLVLGATLHVPETEFLTDPDRLVRWMQQNEITVMHLTPPLGQVLSDNPLFVVATVYAVQASAIHVGQALEAMMRDFGGDVESGELVTREQSAGRLLSQAVFARWGERNT